MPTHESWYCCHCKMGPNSPDIDLSCPSCYHPRCYDCPQEMASTYSDAEQSLYPGSLQSPIISHHHTCETSDQKNGPPPLSPSVFGFHGLSRPPSSTTRSLEMHPTCASDHLDIRHHGGILNQRPTATAYYCCQCSDGPKLYEVQPVCINCSHHACGSCTPA